MSRVAHQVQAIAAEGQDVSEDAWKLQGVCVCVCVCVCVYVLLCVSKCAVHVCAFKDQRVKLQVRLYICNNIVHLCNYFG